MVRNWFRCKSPDEDAREYVMAQVTDIRERVDRIEDVLPRVQDSMPFPLPDEVVERYLPDPGEEFTEPNERKLWSLASMSKLERRVHIAVVRAYRAKEQVRCSFCSKHRMEVGYLIGGDGHIYICSECLRICNELAAEIDREEESPSAEN